MPAIAAAVARRFAPWPEALPLDTTKPPAEVAGTTRSALGRF